MLLPSSRETPPTANTYVVDRIYDHADVDDDVDDVDHDYVVDGEDVDIIYDHTDVDDDHHYDRIYDNDDKYDNGERVGIVII